MKIAKVYDNGGKTFDCFTVTFEGHFDPLGLGDNCDRLTQEEQK